MDARLERKLRLFAVIVVAGVDRGSVVFSLALGHTSPCRHSGGSRPTDCCSASRSGHRPVRPARPDARMARRPFVHGRSDGAECDLRRDHRPHPVLPAGRASSPGCRSIRPTRAFWIAIVLFRRVRGFSNLVVGIANLIGPRALLNFITGRYHAPVEENRFVLFVDIAGSTGLAERLGGVGIHRLLDRTFRLLTACGRRLSRRGPQLCRRRGDRDLAGRRRSSVDVPSAALLHGDAR